jgi:hypothetical protein
MRGWLYHAIALAVLIIGLTKGTADIGVASGEMVNRNGKGDRLPIAASHRVPAKQLVQTAAPRALPRDQELAEGCEPLASSLSRSSLANIAGRCLS